MHCIVTASVLRRRGPVDARARSASAHNRFRRVSRCRRGMAARWRNVSSWRFCGERSQVLGSHLILQYSGVRIPVPLARKTLQFLGHVYTKRLEYIGQVGSISPQKCRHPATRATAGSILTVSITVLGNIPIRQSPRAYRFPGRAVRRPGWRLLSRASMARARERIRAGRCARRP